MATAEDLTISSQYPYSVKLEETSKGVRVHVHVYSNSQNEVIEEIEQTYLKTKQKLMDDGIQLAPMEGNNK